MSAIIGKKLGITSIYNQQGDFIPVTVVQAGPCNVITVRTTEKDGYNALLLGYGTKKEKNISKPVLGQYKKNNLTPNEVMKEFRTFDVASYKVGDQVSVELFKEGDIVKVRGKSKGKGFQGVMKRHGFSGVGGTTHGQSDRLRAPGSIGSSSYPSRVFKGQRMAGRTGFVNKTVSNLKIVKIIPEKNILLVKGSVPGAVNSIVEVIKK
jgi:large subunit ribosomal protein L3